MTVEQPALPRYAQTKPCDDHTYAQVREITGITDRQLIHEAVSACTNNEGKFEVAHVVNMLIADEAAAKSKQNKKMAITYHKNASSKDSADAVANFPQGNANSIKKSKGVIDLTNVSESNESDDIQKAIAASLADNGTTTAVQETSGILGGQVSREEQDISRVLEQSLIESKAGTKRKRGDIWFVDPLNPHERKRTDDWPIGLKNVGNTCWFSAVIQSLFHLRKFRHLVLTYQPNKQTQGSMEEKRNLRFMHELRHLFALMVGSRRKYVDPSKSVDILKEAFASSVVNNTGVSDSQQDVSEFQHKLLEWLEDAFKSASRPSSPAEGSTASPKCTNNPMVDLFYGQYRADGVNEGISFRNEENFGQFPLQVNGFRDIHESLDAATAHREIEAVSEESTQKSAQELWFTRLPPVLTFELSRFQFNQHLGRPEKIHNKIEFPQVIYMDRYMDCNRDETRERRERAKKLKEELVGLQARLDKFINYGSGVKRFPLQDVLLYALEFAKSQPEHVRRHASLSQDVEMECPSPSQSMQVDSPVKSPVDVAMATMTSPTPHSTDLTKSPSLSAKSPAQAIPDITMSPGPSSSSTPPDVPMATLSKSPQQTVAPSSPYPRHVSSGELEVLQDCLHRWRTEVESDVRDLQGNISALEDSINRMYSDEAMTKKPYHLHAVLVHEGQAASGHYWAYIYDTGRGQWLKFNDITVTEASWEELEKDSMGGYHNASAYCLMYIDKSCFFTEKGPEMIGDLDNLPDELKEVVTEDNKLFTEEIEKWDRDMQRKVAGGGGGDADVTVIVGDSPDRAERPGTHQSSSSNTVSTQTIVTTLSAISSIHANLACSESRMALKKALELDSIQKKGPEEVLINAMQLERTRVEGIVHSLPQIFPHQDPRLQHMATYLLHCRASRDMTELVFLEQVIRATMELEPFKKIKQHAEHRFLALKEGEGRDKQYLMWHEMYQSYRKTVILYIKGVSLYLEEKHTEALSYLVHSHMLSEQLRKRNENAGLCEPRVSAFFLRQTLLHINDTITHQFEEMAEVGDLLVAMNTYVLPCLPTLLQSGLRDDETAVEEIREKWCSFLGQDIGPKVEQLQDFLSKLFDPPLDLRIPKMPSLRQECFQNIHKQYAAVMENAKDCGYIERALKTS